jgi:hypothetical protein
MAKKRVKVAAPRRKAPALKPDDVFGHLSIKHVRLVNVHAQLRITDGKVPTKAEVGSQTTIGPTGDKAALHADTIVSLTGYPQDGPVDDGSRLEIVAHYQVVYIPEGFPVEAYLPHAELIAKNGILVAWPHLRELIQSLTSRMDIPQITLPFYTVGPGIAQIGLRAQPLEPAPRKKRTNRPEKK